MKLWTLELFRALQHRNFRLFFYGQMLSMAGTWMQRVAQGWLAYRLTGSANFLGLVAFTGSAPAFFLSPLAGVVADRVNRHRMLMIAQTLAMAQSFLLALATLRGSITPTQLVALALLLGAINAFENPARQAFFVEMISREDLTNAIALNASIVNAARIVGPASAGLLVAAYGEGVCFLLNGLSFLAVIAALAMMRLTRRPKEASPGSGPELLREGFAFVRQTLPVRSLLSLFAVLNLAGTPYITLLPIFAGTVLHAGPTGLGWLMAASGLGALVCAIALASRSDTRKLPGAVMRAAFVFAAALIVLGLSHFLSLSLMMMLLIGGGYIVTLAATQTLLQTWVPDGLRGRVMSFYSLIFLGFPPFGSLLAGWFAEKIGAPLTVSLGGVICLIAALRFAQFHSAQRTAGYDRLEYSR
ncbi:MAG: MFS transporter [Acidobacteria bacterium]|nr:MFS transporter [Acidobacteriota bacterium]